MHVDARQEKLKDINYTIMAHNYTNYGKENLLLMPFWRGSSDLHTGLGVKAMLDDCMVIIYYEVHRRKGNSVEDTALLRNRITVNGSVSRHLQPA